MTKVENKSVTECTTVLYDCVQVHIGLGKQAHLSLNVVFFSACFCQSHPFSLRFVVVSESVIPILQTVASFNNDI